MHRSIFNVGERREIDSPRTSSCVDAATIDVRGLTVAEARGYTAADFPSVDTNDSTDAADDTQRQTALATDSPAGWQIARRNGA